MNDGDEVAAGTDPNVPDPPLGVPALGRIALGLLIVGLLSAAWRRRSQKTC